METLIAIAHLVGSVIGSIVFWFIAMAVAGWENDRNQSKNLEAMSLEMGVAIAELESGENRPKVLLYLSAKFSQELLRNRLADLCGALQWAWGGVGWLIQAGVFIGAIWQMFTGSLSGVVIAWTVIPIAIFFWMTSIAFGLICKLLTGRYPWQPKNTRKALLDMVQQGRANEIPNRV